MAEHRLFAIDLGASGGKCFAGTFADGAFSLQEVHRFEHEAASLFIPDEDGRLVERTYWDDILIYRNILAGLRAYRRNVSDRLDSLGLDTWGADGHFMSAEGELLGKVYCYRDHRLDTMIAQVKARIEPRRMYQLTGIHFQPFNVSNQLHWFVNNRRDLLRPGCFYLPIPSLFYYYLSGVRVVDSSWASVTQLMDARLKAWSPEILGRLEIPSEVMPDIVAPGTVVGELLAPVAELVGLNRAKLVAVASHDTASAFAAAPVANPAQALIVSSGTWSLVGKLVPEPITSDKAMAANLSNEGGIGNVRFLKNCMGTWLVQELRRLWAAADGREMSWEEITALARQAPAFHALIDPDDPSFYNPPNMERAIADFCGRKGEPVPPDRGSALRTVYESLALKYRFVNAQICEASATTTRVVNIVGGGSRNDLLNQFTADAMGLPVQAGPEEATAVGNFMVQALGLGLIDSMADVLPIVQRAFVIREYAPRDPDAWERAYARFRRIAS